MHHRIITLPLAALALAALTGCDRAPAGPELDIAASATQDNREAVPVRAHGDLLKAVRQATSRYHSTEQAVRAGYAEEHHCVAHPQAGGMGFHWANVDLVDPAFDPTEPEVLLYTPDAAGNFRLGGVEYVVIALPGQELDGPARPTFDGHPFDIGGVGPLTQAGVPHWSLHVWVHLENPAGTFAPFNPSVSCN